MNRLTALLFVAALAGCASAPDMPTTSLQVDKTTQPMSRNEIINAVRECEESGLRAVVIMSKRHISGMTSDVVIDVTCMPVVTRRLY